MQGRSSLLLAPILEVPGPGAYTPDITPTKPAAPAITMSTRLEQNNVKEEGPGPGEYHSDVTCALRGPAYTIPIDQAPAEEVDFVPGPGEYNTIQSSTGAAFSFPRGEASHVPRDDHQPGPGEYSIAASTAGPAFSIPKAQLNDLVSEKSGPGPGIYDTAVLESGPSFTMAGKGPGEKISGADDKVGPGTYDQKPLPSGPAYTIQVLSPQRCFSLETQNRIEVFLCVHHAHPCMSWPA
jgi:hypothetical protein